MRWSKLTRAGSPALAAAFALLVAAATAEPVGATQMRVMVQGLGTGTVSSSPAGIFCPTDCEQPFGSATLVTLTATAGAGSVFTRWEGDCAGTLTTTCNVTVGAGRSVRAVFGLFSPIPELSACASASQANNCIPGDIEAFLAANPAVNTPARFMAALPVEFRRNWILMSRSESLQTGTAAFPRVLLPSADARFVFTLGLATHSSYPGAHPNAIEYMQWDPVEKNFRFHEIVLDAIPAMDPDGDGVGAISPRARGITVDDVRCTRCHSTRNIRHPGPGIIGTTGDPVNSVKAKNKPNWDSYDSWGGMTPFNRDRIYQGSVEAAAFRRIFNPWTWSGNPEVQRVFEQLELQPPGISPAHSISRLSGGPFDGHVVFGFDPPGPVLEEPEPTGSSAITTNYSFDGQPGSGTPTSVTRGGDSITLHHSLIPGSDEGRGVRFFDALGGLAGRLNQTRIADELTDHRWATGNVFVEIRPVALAITKSCLAVSAGTDAVITSPGTGAPALAVDQAFFTARNGMSINELVLDTRDRAFDLPRRKADIERRTLDRTDEDPYLLFGEAPAGLIQEYGAATAPGTSTVLTRLRQEVFRRPIDVGVADRSVMGGIYVDRELASNVQRIALYRFFLEPFGVSVDKWSMGVRGRSRTYTFADVLGTYLDVLQPELEASLTARPVAGLGAPYDCAALVTAVNSTLGSLPAVGAVPTYTDVQRIFNKGCIECHGGLDYPPYGKYFNTFDLSEHETPPAGQDRLDRSQAEALTRVTSNPATSFLYNRITQTTENCPYGLMPCGGPALSRADIETIRRWIVGAAPNTRGDPHIKTVDGLNYDFQAAGEYVMLRGQGFEIQVRQDPVPTAGPLGPNPYTGLTSCVSVNSAAAVRVGGNRITYQPNRSGQRDPSGLQLRLNGELQQINEEGTAVALPGGGRIIQTTAPAGIQIEAPGGTVVVLTPGWWNHHQLWYLNVDVRHARATRGVMGAIPRGSWLPSLPDGTPMGPMPRSLPERYAALYERFGNAWRVTPATSLFDYAPGTSTDTYTLASWPNGESPSSCTVPPRPGLPPTLPAATPLPLADAEQHCSGLVADDARANCVQDVMVTGEPGFARTYLFGEAIERNRLPSPPALVAPLAFDTVLTTVAFKWRRTSDRDGNRLTYRHCLWDTDDRYDINDCGVVATQAGWLGRGLFFALIVALLGFILLLFLISRGRLSTNLAVALLALVILVAAVAAYFVGGGGSVSRTIEALEPGRAYYWKVVAEDGRGGTVESETRRFQVSAV